MLKCQTRYWNKKECPQLRKASTVKRAIVRIQNAEESCLVRALVVSIAKIESDSRYKSIAGHLVPIQTQLVYELHEKARVSIGSCSSDEVKRFQTCFSDYHDQYCFESTLNWYNLLGSRERKKDLFVFA